MLTERKMRADICCYFGTDATNHFLFLLEKVNDMTNHLKITTYYIILFVYLNLLTD